MAAGEVAASLGRLLSRHWLVCSFLALALLLGVTAPGFLTVSNFRSVGTQVPVNLIIAVGMMLVVLTGGIDLSVGSVHALAGVAAAMVLTNAAVAESAGAAAVPLALSAGLVAALAAGGLNGLAIARFHLPPFIVTLAMMRICRGLSKQMTNGLPIGSVDPSQPLGEQINRNLEAVRPLGFGYVWDLLPVPLLIALGIVVAAAVLLGRTSFGRSIYGIGGSENAARLSGVNVARVKVIVYLLCGGLAGLAGVLEMAQLQSGSPIAGEGYELNAIAAVVVGGTSLSGGRGTVFGTLVGAVFVIGVMNNALNLYNVQPFWQEVISGAIIFVVALLDRISRGRAA